MKSVLAGLTLSLLSSVVIAAGSPAAAADACVAPVIPPLSTSQVGAQRVEKSVKAWNECVANQDADEYHQRDEAVKARLKEWLAATIQYSNANGDLQDRLTRDDFERIESHLTFAERERFKTAQRNAWSKRTAAPAPAEYTGNKTAMALLESDKDSHRIGDPERPDSVYGRERTGRVAEPRRD